MQNPPVATKHGHPANAFPHDYALLYDRDHDVRVFKEQFNESVQYPTRSSSFASMSTSWTFLSTVRSFKNCTSLINVSLLSFPRPKQSSLSTLSASATHPMWLRHSLPLLYQHGFDISAIAYAPGPMQETREELHKRKEYKAIVLWLREDPTNTGRLKPVNFLVFVDTWDQIFVLDLVNNFRGHFSTFAMASEVFYQGRMANIFA